jgi:kynurenine 3-monooxygenase
MDKRAIHLVDKLNFQNYGQEGEYLLHFQRDLNRRMIDLAEQAGAEFSSNRKFGTLPYLKLLYTLEKRKRSLGRKKYDMVLVQMVL